VLVDITWIDRKRKMCSWVCRGCGASKTIIAGTIKSCSVCSAKIRNSVRRYKLKVKEYRFLLLSQRGAKDMRLSRIDTLPRRLKSHVKAERDHVQQEGLSVGHDQIVRLPKRSECEGGPRPCPLVSCRYHLGLDVSRYGSIRRNRSELYPIQDTNGVISADDVEKWLRSLPETCALDVADRGEHGIDALGWLLGVSRERARQIEFEAMCKISNKLRKAGIEPPPWSIDVDSGERTRMIVRLPTVA